MPKEATIAAASTEYATTSSLTCQRIGNDDDSTDEEHAHCAPAVTVFNEVVIAGKIP
jgi:hypothetical protein